MCNNKIIHSTNCGMCNQSLDNNAIIKTIDIKTFVYIIEDLLTVEDFNKDALGITNNIIKCNGRIYVDATKNIIEIGDYSVFNNNKQYIYSLISKWLSSKPIRCTRVQFSALELAHCLMKGYTSKDEILTILQSVQKLIR